MRLCMQSQSQSAYGRFGPKFHLFFLLFFPSSGSIFLVHILYITVANGTEREKVRHCWDHQSFEFVATYFSHGPRCMVTHETWRWNIRLGSTKTSRSFHSISFHLFSIDANVHRFCSPLRVEYRTAAGIETNSCIFRYMFSLLFNAWHSNTNQYFDYTYSLSLSHTLEHNGICCAAWDLCTRWRV